MQKLILYYYFFAVYFSLYYCSRLPFLFRYTSCNSTKCFQQGPTIKSLLNETVAPCENFYNYACQKWHNENRKPTSELTWSPWDVVYYRINDKIQKILNSNTDRSASVEKSKIFYDSCINTKKHLNDLRNMINELYGSYIKHENEKRKTCYWMEMIFKTTMMLNIYPIIKLKLDIDYENNTHFAFYMGHGDSILPQHIITNPKNYATEIAAYKEWIFKTLKYLYPMINRGAIKTDVKRIFKFEYKLAEFRRKSESKRITLEEFSRTFKCNMFKVLQLFKKNETHNFDLGYDIILENAENLSKLIAFLQRSDIKTMVSYLRWSVIKDVSREVSQYMKDLNFMINRVLYGYKADVTRQKECLNQVRNYFSNALASNYIKDNLSLQTMKNVEEMIKNIKAEYVDMIKQSKWLSDNTRQSAIEKAENIKSFIGCPEWVTNNTSVELYYSKVNITENHFKNVISIKSNLAKQNFLVWNRRATDIKWPASCLDVNAFYSIIQNSIYINLGILDSYFYENDRPRYVIYSSASLLDYANNNVQHFRILNYGALGSLIGHEIAHSLDVTGRQLDKDGNFVTWWPNEDVVAYDAKVSCYDEYYKKFDIDNLLGTGENLADNIGVELSLKAYLKVDPNIIVMPNLPILDSRQLFFIAFAQMWCEISEETDLFVNDVHAPAEIRVRATLYNNEQFRRSFNCQSSRTEYFCTLWK